MRIKKLIKQAKSGRSEAQRALYDLTCAQLNSVALRYVVERSLAEDVLQESYIRIFKSCLLYTSPSPRDQRGSRMPSSA